MTLYPPLYVQAGGGDTPIQMTGLDLRLGTQSVWATEGVITGLEVTQRAAGANFSVDIAAGQAVITGNDVAVQGTYIVTSDAVENRIVPGAPVSGSRTHRVIAYVRDKLYDAGLAAGTYDFVLQVLEDTGSGTPAAPASAITLALVTVTSATTSITTGANIAAGYIHAMPKPGRARLTASAAERPPVPLNFEELGRTDLGDIEVFADGTWRMVGLNAPYAILTTNANQSVATATNASVTFASELRDTHGGHDNSTNNTRYTAQRSGLYRVAASIPWAITTAAGKFETWFRVDGTTEYAGSTTWKETANVTLVSQATALLELNAGQYVEVRVWQGTGGARSMDKDYKSGPRFEIEWLRSL